MKQTKDRILVVDDHPRNVTILQKILGAAYEIATAASGEEALRVAPTFGPDLVLLDIMMPGIDGYETCRQLRADATVAAAKIIMVSAKAMLSERLAGYEAGADDYMIKPFDEDELLAKVRVYLRLKSVEELDRLKTDILTLLSHETRTPLTTILGPLEMILGDADLSPRARQMAQMAQDSARRVHELLDKALYLSGLKAGLVHFELGRHDLGAVVHESLDKIHPAAEREGVELAWECADPVEVDCDAAQIQWSVAALLSNAVRFSPKPGTVLVNLTAREACASLSVADRGPGIPEHFLAHVFECFSVPDILQHSSGHSLSLATASTIVRRHGGSLRAENRPGGGALFELRLPLGTAAAEGLERRASGNVGRGAPSTPGRE